jgi:hypothetical protein
LEAFLVGEDEVTRDYGGLLLWSQGHWRAWNVGWSGLGALLGNLNCRSVNVRRSVRHRSLEISVCERQNGILHRIEWCVKIVRSGNVGRHLLCWFDSGDGGWVCLGVRRTGERSGDMVDV